MWPKFFQLQKTVKKIFKTFRKSEKSSFQNEYINRKNISLLFLQKKKCIYFLRAFTHFFCKKKGSIRFSDQITKWMRPFFSKKKKGKNAHSKKKWNAQKKNTDEKICKFFVFLKNKKTKKEEKQPLFLFYIHFFSLKKSGEKILILI